MSEVKLYLGDCLDILPTLESESVDAVITDPPYGIEITKSPRISITKGYDIDGWDDKRVKKEIKEIYKKYSDKSLVIWGGHYYSDLLPFSRAWLIWDKINDGLDFGEADLAWTNLNQVIRKYKRSSRKIDNGKQHPTQKPIELMKWCIEMGSNSGDMILDPFMGSGTTGVACVQTGRDFIGIEIEPKYYEIAERRIKEAQLQIRMPI